MINQIDHTVEVNKLIQKFPGVFSNRIGTFKYKKISLKLKPGSNPIFRKPRTVPLAYRKMMDEEIDKLIDQGILTPTETSDWATPLVPVLKKDGRIRLCGDYKSTCNQHLVEEHYPLPRIEELFAKLHNGEYFTKLDLCQAYNQFELDEEAKGILTWSTHRGLFTMNRMPFGITPASGKFQKYIEQIFQGMDNVAVYQDDILVTGPTNAEHLKMLEKVLRRLDEAGLTVRKEKCLYFQRCVEYLGHSISKEGLRKTETKVNAILEAPRPTNVTETRSLLGMINFYAKFIPNLAQILKPLYNLLHKDKKFEWSKDCQNAFNEIKEKMSSDNVLIHFNPDLPLILSTDASQHGISGVLSHRMPNGDERPISCVSRTLLPAEEKYSVIHKEALAIYFSVTKFYQYLCGRKFILRTDHKPLIALFGEHKEIPKMYENRLQRWAAFLSGMKYTIEYIEGKENTVADYFSRAPIKANPQDYGDISYVNFTSTVGEWPVDNREIRRQVEKDDQLQEVMKYVQQNNWPKDVNEGLRPYFNRRDELSIDNGILMWGLRIVMPTTVRKRLLNELHEGHFGIVKMKSMARSFMYWPKIDQDIEKMVKSCSPCMLNRQAPQKSELTPWPIETAPWKRIHIDFLGPIEGKTFFIVVDAFTKWIETFQMRSITTEETIEKLRELFARFGLPAVVVSDNGRQLVSQKMQQFFKQNGIRHITSPVANPQSNGLAENAVKTFKNKLKTLLMDENQKGGSLNTLVSRILFQHRTTKHCSTGQTPSKLMFGRDVRTRLTLLKENQNEKPSNANEAILEMKKSQIRQKRNYRGRVRNIAVGERVIVRDYTTQNEKKWTPATVIKKVGRSTYLCKIDRGNIWKRHQNQIQQCEIQEQPARKRIVDLINHTPPVETSQATVSRTPSDDPLDSIVSDIDNSDNVNRSLDDIVNNVSNNDNVNDEQTFYDCDNNVNSDLSNHIFYENYSGKAVEEEERKKLIDSCTNSNVTNVQSSRPQRRIKLPSKLKEYITDPMDLDKL